MKPKAPCKRRRPTAGTGAGFSLIEVMIALLFAGILSLMYIETQERNIRHAEDALNRLEHINLAQEYLTDNPFYVERRLSSGWVRMNQTGFEEEPEKEWSLDLVKEAPLNLSILKIRYQGTITSWTWVVP